MRDPKIGVGPTAELSLRISVATLARVVFPHPEEGIPMLALEHKATWVSGDAHEQVLVKAQPFGGAIRILDLNRFLAQVGNFNFDSERSRDEQDFRVYVPPVAWGLVREYCLRNLSQEDTPDLETDIARELEEEFEETLGISLEPDQYSAEPLRIVTENTPLPSPNVYSADHPTVRIYRIFNIQLHDPILFRLMIANSEKHPTKVMQRLALEDAQSTGRGRANAILTVPEEKIRSAYLAIPPEMRGVPLPFGNTLLEGNVAAVFEDLLVPKYSLHL